MALSHFFTFRFVFQIEMVHAKCFECVCVCTGFEYFLHFFHKLLLYPLSSPMITNFSCFCSLVVHNSFFLNKFWFWCTYNSQQKYPIFVASISYPSLAAFLDGDYWFFCSHICNCFVLYYIFPLWPIYMEYTSCTTVLNFSSVTNQSTNLPIDCYQCFENILL